MSKQHPKRKLGLLAILLATPQLVDAYVLTVKVVSADNQQPVSGAAVSISGGFGFFKRTDLDGEAVFDGLLDSGTRFIQVTHDGFEPAKQPVVIKLDGPYRLSAVVSLSKKALTGKKVTVTVVSQDDKLPVAGASVMILSRDAWDAFDETTDDNGNAVVGVDGSGTFDVRAYHSAFKSGQATLALNRFSDQREFAVRLELERKPRSRGRGRRTLTVNVTGKQRDGRTVPIAGATIVMPDGRQSRTTAAGETVIRFDANHGEDVEIDVMAEGYRSKHAAFLAGRTITTYLGLDDELAVVLDPVKALLQSTLIILVLDAETNLPLGEAGVAVKQRDGPASAGKPATTKANGEAVVELDPNIVKSGWLRATVRKQGYAEKWSDIAPELTEPAEQPRTFTIYLAREAAPAAGVTNLAGTWKDAYGIARVFTQTGNQVRSTTDFMFGNFNIHEVITATVTTSKLEGNYITASFDVVRDGQSQPTAKNTGVISGASGRLSILWKSPRSVWNRTSPAPK